MSKWNNYKAPNLGLLFYKRLYKDIKKNNGNLILVFDKKKDCLKFDVDEKKSEFNNFYNDLYNFKLSKYNSKSLLGKPAFTLKTTYPGLLLGSGYAHSTKATGDSSIGFYFDHTSGLPVIPGSSIKGVLRSLFELDILVNKRGDKKEYTDEKSLAAIVFILSEILIETNLEEKVKNKIKEFKDTINVPKLSEIKEEIFGNQDKEGCDVFFDAHINIELSEKKFIDSDFITPHHPNLLRNPIPIQFVKVLPNICFDFRFKLTNNGIDASIKELLFRQILLTLGIGAKTNVGYGQFVPAQEKKDTNETEQKNNESDKVQDTAPVVLNHSIKDKKSYIAKENYNGKITDIKNGQYFIAVSEDILVKSKKAADNKLTKDNAKKEKKGKRSGKNSFEKGEVVTVRINKNFTKEINFTILPAK